MLILQAFRKEAIFAFVLIITLVFPPYLTYASFFGLFLKTSADTGVVNENSSFTSDNSQNTRILEPISAIDPKVILSNEGDITIKDSALIPEMGPLGTMADVEDAPLTDEISVYVVKSGDTISTVADLFDVSSNTVMWANNLTKGQPLTPGQTLIILPVSGVSHTVKKGETLRSIANKYKADIGDVGAFNGITEETPLTVGDTIIIPDGEMTAPATNTPKKIIRKRERTYNTNAPAVSGYFINPVPGARLSQGLHANNGVDLAAPTGTPIYASAGGTVIVARGSGYNGGFGKMVVINHPNGTQTLYAHMSSVVASQGGAVAQGELIGYVGSTGHSTGPHLHFEVHGAKNPGSNNSWAQ